MRFRKKPVVIEAIHWDGKNWDAVDNFLPATKWWMEDGSLNHLDQPIIISTLDGNMRANIGDWIIRGVKGEFYPCKPALFEATYEPVSD